MEMSADLSTMSTDCCQATIVRRTAQHGLILRGCRPRTVRHRLYERRSFNRWTRLRTRVLWTLREHSGLFRGGCTERRTPRSELGPSLTSRLMTDNPLHRSRVRSVRIRKVGLFSWMVIVLHK